MATAHEEGCFTNPRVAADLEAVATGPQSGFSDLQAALTDPAGMVVGQRGTLTYRQQPLSCRYGGRREGHSNLQAALILQVWWLEGGAL